jgi:hypothetical protein
MKANDQKCISKIPFKHDEPHNKMEFLGIGKNRCWAFLHRRFGNAQWRLQ